MTVPATPSNLKIKLSKLLPPLILATVKNKDAGSVTNANNKPSFSINLNLNKVLLNYYIKECYNSYKEPPHYLFSKNHLDKPQLSF